MPACSPAQPGTCSHRSGVFRVPLQESPLDPEEKDNVSSRYQEKLVSNIGDPSQALRTHHFHLPPPKPGFPLERDRCVFV